VFFIQEYFGDQNKEEKYVICSTHWSVRNALKILFSEKFYGTGHLGNLGIYGRMILKLSLRK
jgi:hypothetical protein